METMFRLVTLAACLLTVAGMEGQTAHPLSFGDALRQMQRGNRTLRMADKEVEQAREERGKLNAYWYPSLQSEGAFVHLSEKIEVKQPLLSSLELSLPLAPRNLTSVGLTAEWVVFSGGRRIRASKMGKTMVDLARENREQTEATQRALLVESYFGLRLAEEAVRVRQETCRSLQRHYEHALRMEAEGMIDRAGVLFAQVNRDEALRAWEDARKEVGVVRSGLCYLLNLTDTCALQPTTPLFINDSLPDKSEFTQAMQVNSYALNRLRMQKQLARRQLRNEQSGYLPSIALFGKQTLYAHGIESNLVPRTMMGVGFTWTLFDGLSRERRIRQARLTQQTLAIGEEKAREEMDVGIDKLYARLQKAQDNVRTLAGSIALSEELVRIRRKSFAEGMATATEVVDAETLLADSRLARLAACYEYDVALMNLLALCGTPEEFEKYIVKD